MSFESKEANKPKALCKVWKQRVAAEKKKKIEQKSTALLLPLRGKPAWGRWRAARWEEKKHRGQKGAMGVIYLFKSLKDLWQN